jgi:hypothetical protein
VTYVEYLAETKADVEAPRAGFPDDVCAAIERVRKTVAVGGPREVFGGGRHK